MFVVADHSELKKLAEAFPEYEWDSNTEPFFNGPSGESLGGGSTGFYCVYGPDFEIDGDSYEGVTLVESCPADQAKFICKAKAGILALIAENDRLTGFVVKRRAQAEQYDQALIQIAEQRDQLKAEIAGIKTGYEAFEQVNAGLRAEVEGLRKALAECANSLHGEMLQKYHGQKPEGMHPVTRRDYDRDMSELTGYAAMGKGEQS